MPKKESKTGTRKTSGKKTPEKSKPAAATRKTGKSPAKRTQKSTTGKKTTKRPAAKSPSKNKRTGKSPVKRVVIISVIVILVLIGTGIILLMTNLNMLVKMAIEKAGSKVVQTAVRVDHVNIRLKEASAGIAGLTVANPRGFETEHAFSLGQISVDIDASTVTEDELRIDKILVDAMEIFTEVNEENKNNLNEIKKNLLTEDGAAPSGTGTKKETKEKTIFIRRFVFSQGALHAKVVPMDKEYHIRMPSMVLRNVRGTPDQIARQVLSRITNTALREVKRKGIGEAKEELGKKAKSELESQKKKVLNPLKKIGF